MIATLTGQDAGGDQPDRRCPVGGAVRNSTGGDPVRGAQGLDPELIAAIEAQFGFDQPIHVRYLKMLGDYLTFDLGTSYYQDRPVVDLIKERLPVSISLGLWSIVDHLCHLDPARRCQGGSRRDPVRRLDQRGDLRRLRGTELPVRPFS